VFRSSLTQCSGTLGAIFGIFFASFQTSLRALILSSSTRPIPLLLSQAAFQALETLQTYTPARVGDRTVLDVLIPFVHTLEASQGDLSEAAGVAEKAAEGTRRLVPKLGRATYVEIGEGQLPPDPGAWAVWELVRGLRDGLNEAK
jgi:dihydroxyacetone kinase